MLLAAVLLSTQRISAGWLIFVLGLIPVALAFALGGGLVVAGSVAAVPDTKKMLPPVFRLVFCASGAIFPLAPLLDGHPVEPFLPLNPFYLYVEISRHLLLEPRESARSLWAAALARSLVGFVFGNWFLARREHLLVRP